MKEIGESADWILKLHSDNPLKSHWLTTMLSVMEHCPDQIATISSSWDDPLPDGKIVKGEDDANGPPEIIPGGIAPVRSTLLKGCWWHNSGCALRMKAYKDIGDFEPDWKQKGDWDWLLRCLYKGWSVMYIPRTLFYYSQVNKNLSTGNLQKDIDIRESIRIFHKYLNIVSLADIAAFHSQNLTFALRRFGRSVITLNLQRLGCTLRTFFLILESFVKCLFYKTSVSRNRA